MSRNDEPYLWVIFLGLFWLCSWQSLSHWLSSLRWMPRSITEEAIDRGVQAVGLLVVVGSYVAYLIFGERPVWWVPLVMPALFGLLIWGALRVYARYIG